jgi:Do/DeqQ family serine protease
MNHEQTQSDRLSRRATRTIGAAIAGLVLLTGAAWHGASANAQSSAAHAAIPAVSTPIQHSVAGGRDSYADVVKVVAPSVVTIRAQGKAKISPTELQGDDLLRRFFGDQFGDQLDRGGRRPRGFKQRALGSGVIVSNDGYILTNYHVVDGADEIRVETTDDRTFTAKVIGTDKPSDLALLKVSASDLHPVALGNSDAVQVGDVVLAVGNPLGVGQTVTMGIISAKGRSTSVGDSYEDFLQTDAPINHGNSGGALVNTKGELVGINSQILSNSDGNIGIGFAIPTNMAHHVMDQLRASGKVTRAQLGVRVQQVTEDLAQSLGLKHAGGVIVASVTPGSAADHAGIKQGDVIESLNGQPVHDFNSLRNRVADAAPGSNATVTILRDGSEKSLTVKLDEANPDKSARVERGDSTDDDKAALGVSVAPLTPELASRLGAPKNAKGLVIEEVNPDGRAADAGLQAGDVIEQVNRRPVESTDQLRQAVKEAGNKTVLLLINRQGNELFVTVRPAIS